MFTMIRTKLKFKGKEKLKEGWTARKASLTEKLDFLIKKNNLKTGIKSEKKSKNQIASTLTYP